MKQIEVLEEIKRFTIPERLTFIEAALHLIREDIQQVKQPKDRKERKRQLAAAAEALLPDYAAGGELTIFTTLDSEDFRA
ncbi:MAG: hypothetical protein FJZ89_10725 [Chloroflexi bacterium]|nr:hypothetical protein [Chloroflexota bacterium]